MKRPNIILVLADDLGYGQLSCYPHIQPVRTPNIDRLATAGLRMTNAYATHPMCGPSRAGLMTGRYPQRFGYYSNDDAVAGIAGDARLVSEYLQDAGYATACFGKWHLGWDRDAHPLSRGFDEYFGFLGGEHDYYEVDEGHTRVEPGEDTLILREGKQVRGKIYSLSRSHKAPIYEGFTEVKEMPYLTEAITEHGLDFIQRHQNRPFFLYLPYNAIHSPHQAPYRYMIPRHYGFDKTDAQLALLDALDDNVGRVLDLLTQLHIEENTAVFLISDNGGYTDRSNGELRGHKGEYFEGGIRVPFLVRWPAGLPANRVNNHPVMTTDVLPTILSAAGIEAQDNIDGHDLLSLWNGETTVPPHEIL